MIVGVNTPAFVRTPFTDTTPKHPAGSRVTNNSTTNMPPTDPFGARSNNRATETFDTSTGTLIQRYDSNSTNGTNARVYSSTPNGRTAETYTQYVVPQSVGETGFLSGTRAAEYSVRSDQVVAPNQEQRTEGEGIATQTPDGQLNAAYQEQRYTVESTSQRPVSFGRTSAIRQNNQVMVDSADYTNLQPNDTGTSINATENRQVAYQTPQGSTYRETQGNVQVGDDRVQRYNYNGVEQTQVATGESTITNLQGNGTTRREEGERQIYDANGRYIGRGVTIRRLNEDGLPEMESGYIRYVDDKGQYNGRLEYTQNGEVVPPTRRHINQDNVSISTR